MLTKGAGCVVVFAMDVVGYCSAESDVLRARRYGQEPAEFYKKVLNGSERDSRFGFENAGFFVK